MWRGLLYHQIVVARKTDFAARNLSFCRRPAGSAFHPEYSEDLIFRLKLYKDFEQDICTGL